MKSFSEHVTIFLCLTRIAGRGRHPWLPSETAVVMGQTTLSQSNRRTLRQGWSGDVSTHWQILDALFFSSQLRVTQRVQLRTAHGGLTGLTVRLFSRWGPRSGPQRHNGTLCDIAYCAVREYLCRDLGDWIRRRLSARLSRRRGGVYSRGTAVITKSLSL